ncbi:MAG: outer membrane lipoprotein-sorting protein [Elusimicrobiota bacterium]
MTSTALLLLLLALPAAAAEKTPGQIVDEANKLLRGNSSHTRLTMTVVTPKWTRALDIEAWNKGREMAYILIHDPPKEKGTTTLRRGSEMWTWMARVERLLKVPPTMMHSSWQGSDFTYEDIVKADSIFKDYTHRLVKVTPGKPYAVHRIEATPKPDAPVVWGKIFFEAGVYPDGWVIPLGEEDYNERGELVRTIRLGEVKIMDGRRVPSRMECLPERKKGRRTVIQYREIQFDIKVPDSFFSVSRLQK